MLLVALSGCSTAKQAVVPYQGLLSPIAVLPIYNLSGTAAPLKEIRRAYIEKLKARGVTVMDEDALEAFMARNRVRYTGGVDRNTSTLFQEEAGVKGIVITSLENYDRVAPPKVSVISRLVSSGPEPKILWMDSFGGSGDDHRGLLDVGLINDLEKMVDLSLTRLSDSMTASLAGQPQARETGRKKFNPKYYYKAPELGIGEQYKVAVSPFFNRSGRRYAGDIMMLLFIEQLYDIPGMDVIEPGVVRDDLLRNRVVMDEGLSLRNVDLVMITLRANLIVMGTVFDYQDYRGVAGAPKVDFTVQMVEKKTMSIVWSSKSQNNGTDGVYFFDIGKVNTADKMASEMVGKVFSIMEEK
jgi:TolB-like protein